MLTLERIRDCRRLRELVQERNRIQRRRARPNWNESTARRRGCTVVEASSRPLRRPRIVAERPASNAAIRLTRGAAGPPSFEGLEQARDRAVHDRQPRSEQTLSRLVGFDDLTSQRGDVLIGIEATCHHIFERGEIGCRAIQSVVRSQAASPPLPDHASNRAASCSTGQFRH